MKCRFRDAPRYCQPIQGSAPAAATAPDNHPPIADARKAVADARASMGTRIRALAALFRQHYGQ